MTTQLDTEKAVIIATTDGVVTMWSSAAEKLFDVAAEEAIGEHIANLAEWNSIPITPTTTGYPLGGVWAARHRVTTRAGKNLILRSRSAQAAGPSGAEEVIVAAPASEDTDAGEPLLYINDVGARVDVTIYCDTEMVIEYVGTALPDIFGYYPRDLVGHKLGGHIHPEDQRWHDVWEWVTATPGSPRAIDVRVQNSEASWLTVNMQIVNLLDDPEIAAIVVNCVDVTSHRRTAEALAVTEYTLRAIIENAQEGMWVIDAAGNTLLANSQMAKLLEIDHASMADEPLPDLFDQRYVDLLLTPVPAHSRARHEVPFHTGSGATRWLRVTVLPRYERADVHAGSILLCHDISVEHRPRPVLPVGRLAGDGPALGPTTRTGRPLSQRLRTVRLRRDGLTLAELLSVREIEVVARLLTGDRVPAIAATMFVSQSTVRNQLASVYRKVGVNSQQELIDLLRPQIR